MNTTEQEIDFGDTTVQIYKGPHKTCIDLLSKSTGDKVFGGRYTSDGIDKATLLLEELTTDMDSSISKDLIPELLDNLTQREAILDRVKEAKMDKLRCPKCDGDKIQEKYVTYLMVNDMDIKKEGSVIYRHCEATISHLTGNFSQNLFCIECTHSWSNDRWYVEGVK